MFDQPKYEVKLGKFIYHLHIITEIKTHFLMRIQKLNDPDNKKNSLGVEVKVELI